MNQPTTERVRWTTSDLERLPESRNRYEIIDLANDILTSPMLPDFECSNDILTSPMLPDFECSIDRLFL
jgi:hypothetical protein